MPWKPDPAVAPGASSRALALRLLPRRRDRADRVACRLPTRPEVALWPAHAGLGRGRHGALRRGTAARGGARHPGGAPYLERPAGLPPPCASADHRRWDHGRWRALGTRSWRVPRTGPPPFPQDRRAVWRGLE